MKSIFNDITSNIIKCFFLILNIFVYVINISNNIWFILQIIFNDFIIIKTYIINIVRLIYIIYFIFIHEYIHEIIYFSDKHIDQS